jgi:hypothetical protein
MILNTICKQRKVKNQIIPLHIIRLADMYEIRYMFEKFYKSKMFVRSEKWLE